MFENLIAGAWTYYVVDANGCKSSFDALITEPSGKSARDEIEAHEFVYLQFIAIGSSATSTQQTKCAGAPSGTITLTAYGGTGEYQYSVCY